MRFFFFLFLIFFLGYCPLNCASTSKLCIADMWINSENYNDKRRMQVIKSVKSNHEFYSNCHGYTYIHKTKSLNLERDPHWTKLYLMKELLLYKCKMVLWIGNLLVFYYTV